MPAREQCLARCEELRKRLEALGIPEDRIEIRYQNCRRECEGKIPGPEPGGGTESPCPGGIKIAPTGSMKAKMTPCSKGWKRVHHTDGYDWCCPPEEGGNGDKDEDKKKNKKCPYGNWFEKKEGEPCPEGYIYRHAGVTPGVDKEACVCVAWCKEQGWGPLCKISDGGGGYWKWSPELQAAFARLLERFNYLMDYPRGTTPEERQKIINFAMKGIKRAERGQRQQTIDELARMGLLGSFMESKELGRLRRGTQEALADLQSRVAIDELDRRFRELIGTTQLAQGLFSTGMSYEQLLEALNAARRAEGRDVMEMLLKYLVSQMGSQNAGYWNTLLNYALSNQSGGGGAGGLYSILPYLIFMMGGG